MSAPWNWEWMTAGELADYYNDLMRRGTDAVLKNVDASGVVGFGIYWGAYSVNDVLEMFLIDPLRLGRGFGAASTAGTWFETTLDILGDVGRAAALLPLGKLVKGIPKRLAKIPEPPSKLPGGHPPNGRPLPGGPHAEGPHVPVPAHAPVVAATAAASRSQAAVSGLLRSLFYFSDPASHLGICAFVSLTQALRHTGRIFASFEAIARIVGVETCGAYFEKLATKAPFFTTEIASWLEKLNFPHELLTDIKNIDALLAHAKTSGKNGVFVFKATWQRVENGVVERVGHIMYIGRTASNEVRIFDRSGHAVKSLEELEKLVPAYHNLRHAMGFEHLGPPIFIPNARLVEVTAKGIKVAGVSFGVGLTIAVPVRVFSFFASSQNGQNGRASRN